MDEENVIIISGEEFVLELAFEDREITVPGEVREIEVENGTSR